MGWKRQDKKKDPGAKVPPGHPFHDLIEEAYLVFAGPKPDDVDVCTHCFMTQATAEDFFRPNIAELPLDYLREWFGAAYPAGGVNQLIWAYLLPRTLEVIAMGEEPDVNGIELSLSRFDTGNPGHWSAAQWSVLDRFRGQFLNTAPSRHHALDETLCMFRRGGWQLDDLLAQVLAMPDEDIVGRLWQDWCDGFGAYGYVSTTNFWQTADAARVRDFYESDALRNRLESIALSDSAVADIAAKASDLVSVIERAA